MSAIISDCGKYRYRLERDVAMDGKLFAYFGINPSTADASINDATVRKWIGFTKVNGGRGFIVGNVFAYRSKDVKILAEASDPIGQDNDMHLQAITESADILVPCWGNEDKVPRALRHNFAYVLKLLRASGKPIKVFGITKSGGPTHPQMLGYSTPLIDWIEP